MGAGDTTSLKTSRNAVLLACRLSTNPEVGSGTNAVGTGKVPIADTQQW
jgi:hypothetical protein